MDYIKHLKEEKIIFDVFLVNLWKTVIWNKFILRKLTKKTSISEKWPTQSIEEIKTKKMRPPKKFSVHFNVEKCLSN